MDIHCPQNAVYWVWLQRKLGIPSRVTYTVADMDGGARRIYESTPDELWRLGIFSVKTINSLNDRDLEMDRRVLERCAETGISVTFPGDENYPRLLLSLPDPPAVLFYKGDIRKAAGRPCVAVVGTRKASQYGRQAAFELSERLSRAGVTVVSGVAQGIDTEAHNGALHDDGGRTIAVLGCGMNYRYNMANENLRQRMAMRSAVLSEYPPDSPPLSYHFPIRNRIISGLSLGTVVIEAEVRSGSLITARLAGEQGRDVFAVPTGVGMRNSSGIHRLLEEGAGPVRSPYDILKHYYAMYPGLISLSGTERPLMCGQEPQEQEPAEEKRPAVRRKPAAPAPEEPDTARLPELVSEGARAMYELLRAEPKLADNLARQAGVSPEDAMAQLSELELLGCARAHPGGRYSLT